LSRVSKSPIVIISDWGNILMIVCCGGDFRCVHSSGLSGRRSHGLIYFVLCVVLCNRQNIEKDRD
jgi:hypothetical protein